MGEHYLDILMSVWRDAHKWIPRSEIKSISILDQTPQEPDPDLVSSGWRGDRFRVWRDGEGNLALSWRTAWRDSLAAKAFQEAYLRVLVRKQRDDSLHTRTDHLALFHDSQAKVWDRVERRGAEVWIAEGVPGPKPFQFPGRAPAGTPHGNPPKP